MVKISDFFNKKDIPEPQKGPSGQEAKESKPQEAIKKEAPVEKSAEIIPMKELKKDFSHQQPVAKPALKTSEIIKDRIQKLSHDQTKAVYDTCLELMRQILDNVKKNEPLEATKIKENVDILIDQILSVNYDLINLTNTYTKENYLYAHSVNVCILSLLLGRGIGYDTPKLQELGFAAFLHDIGMVKVIELSEKSDKLSKEERDKIQEHTSLSVDALKGSADIAQEAIHVAKEHHEWVDGKGYPYGLKGHQISEYAKIVATADSYEALTHPRSHREKFSSHDALKTLLKNKDHFDYRLLKVLIQEITVYPIGSYVQLSSGDIGVVVRTNKESPLRSVVDIIMDSHKRKLKKTKIVDLAKTQTLFIKKPINEKDLSL